MIAEALDIIALDALRYVTIGEGIALMVVSGFSVIDAWIYAWPPDLRLGIGFRWLGRFGLVGFMVYFTFERLHGSMNWYTPWTCTTFTIILIGTWLTRRYDFFWRSRPHGEDAPDVRLREPL